jgi:hypothetical protein
LQNEFFPTDATYLNTLRCGKIVTLPAFYAGFSIGEPETATKIAWIDGLGLKEADLARV